MGCTSWVLNDPVAICGLVLRRIEFTEAASPSTYSMATIIPTIQNPAQLPYAEQLQAAGVVVGGDIYIYIYIGAALQVKLLPPLLSCGLWPCHARLNIVDHRSFIQGVAKAQFKMSLLHLHSRCWMRKKVGLPRWTVEICFLHAGRQGSIEARGLRKGPGGNGLTCICDD